MNSLTKLEEAFVVLLGYSAITDEMINENNQRAGKFWLWFKWRRVEKRIVARLRHQHKELERVTAILEEHEE